MAKLQYARLAANNPIIRVFVQDTSSASAAGLTGLTSASSGLRIDVLRELDATVTSYTVAGSTIETITTLGTYAAPTATKARFKEIDATALPGFYEIHLAQALLGTADLSRFLSGALRGATNMPTVPFEIQLDAMNTQDARYGGLTSLQIQESGTLQAASSTTATLRAGASATDNDSDLVGRILYIESGTGAGQGSRIVSYVGSTKVATIDGWRTTTPDSTSKYIVI